MLENPQNTAFGGQHGAFWADFEPVEGDFEPVEGHFDPVEGDFGQLKAILSQLKAILTVFEPVEGPSKAFSPKKGQNGPKWVKMLSKLLKTQSKGFKTVST